MKEHKEVHANPDNSLLLIIDIQQEQDRFLRGPNMKTANPEHERKKDIVPIVRDLADRARSAGVRVVYTQSIRNSTEAEFTVYGRIPVLQVGTWHSEMADELKPKEQDIVCRKWVPDPWYQTDIERVLKGLHPDPTRCNILLTGGSITGCAYFGITGLIARGYPVSIVTDCVYGPIQMGLRQFSRTTYPTFPMISLTRSDLIRISPSEAAAQGRAEKTVKPLQAKAG